MIEFFGEQSLEIEKEILKVHNKIMEVLSLPENIVLNVSFVSKDEIKQLNKETRNIDSVTDVLSYPYTNLQVGEKLNLEETAVNIYFYFFQKKC